MKKVFFGAAIFICFLAACTKENFLDQTTTTDLGESTVFSDSARSMDFLTNIYASVGFSFSLTRFGAAGLDASCDEAEGPVIGNNHNLQPVCYRRCERLQYSY